jgi:hypothetical protein
MCVMCDTARAQLQSPFFSHVCSAVVYWGSRFFRVKHRDGGAVWTVVLYTLNVKATVRMLSRSASAAAAKTLAKTLYATCLRRQTTAWLHPH